MENEFYKKTNQKERNLRQVEYLTKYMAFCSYFLGRQFTEDDLAPRISSHIGQRFSEWYERRQTYREAI
ncbi:hypothetical protein J4214_03050 [Candidatus Woesearchaeota archaeon]|nr:hypothetical protein [Candidatus Woesearchaeota archaeon]